LGRTPKNGKPPPPDDFGDQETPPSNAPTLRTPLVEHLTGSGLVTIWDIGGRHIQLHGYDEVAAVHAMLAAALLRLRRT
jgi:hypothetical protein